jgi:hypothetical protein
MISSCMLSEFCGEMNHDVGMALENVPEESVCDYLLEPAEKEEEEDEKGAQGKPDNEKTDGKASGGKLAGERSSSLVIFAVDISGSMSSTTEVPDLQG